MSFSRRWSVAGSFVLACIAGFWFAGERMKPKVGLAPTSQEAARASLVNPGQGMSSAAVATGAGLPAVPDFPVLPPARAEDFDISHSARVIASGWSLEMADSHVHFRSWVERWVKGDRSPAALAEGLRLAAARREFLKSLIAAEPGRVLKAAMPFRLRYQMPAEVLALLETRVDGVGSVSSLAATSADGRPLAESKWTEAQVGDTTYRAHPAGMERKRTLEQAFLHGVALDRDFAITSSPLRMMEAGEVPAANRPLVDVCPISGTVTPLAQAPPPEPAGAEKQEAPADMVDAGEHYVRLCAPQHVSLFERRLAAREESSSPWLEQTLAAGSEGTSAFLNFRPAASWTTGAKKTLAIRVDFSDLPGAPISESALAATFNGAGGVREFYERASFGRSSVQVAPATGGDSEDITPVLRMPRKAFDYAIKNDNAALHADARAAAAQVGFSLALYDRIGVYFASLSDIPDSQIKYGGLAQVRGRYHWLNGYFSAGIIAHEIGHNYGLPHASLRRVAPGSSAVANDGTHLEYGDVFDVMGSGSPPNAHFNMWAKAWLHWLDEEGTQVVTASGTYRIARFDHPSGNPSDPALPLALRIARQGGTEYWVGHRRLFTSNSDASNGAYIIWGKDTGNDTRLIDCRTPSDTTASDAPLPVGSSFVDSEAGVTIETLARGGSGAGEWLDVRVTLISRLAVNGGAVEVAENGGTGHVMIHRELTSEGPASVAWASAAGTATAPEDFAAAGGTLNWQANEVLPRLLPVPLVADAVADDNENFVVSLSDFNGATALPEANPITVAIRESGAFDGSFRRRPSINSTVRKVVQDSKGRVLLGGSFYGLGEKALNLVARLLPDGAEDLTFSPLAIQSNGTAFAIAVQPDGKILVGGSFSVTGAPPYLVRLNEDGSVDSTFNVGSGPDDDVRSIVLLPDGKILVAGEFATFNGVPRKRIVRLTSSGAVDSSFVNPALVGDQALISLALQPDGKIIAGGMFRTSDVPPFGWSICRLQTDGALDPSFIVGDGAHGATTSTGSFVDAVAVLPDGRVAFGGAFSSYRGTMVNRFVVATSTGERDATFATGFNSGVRGITPLPDGRLLVNGIFSNTLGAQFVNSEGLVLFNTDGSVDRRFTANHGLEEDVNSVWWDAAAGRLLAGGWTSWFDGGFNTPVFKLFAPLPGQAPAVTSQPVGGNLAQGGGLTLTVGVNVTGPYVQWYRDGLALPGATTLSYVISNASTGDSGSYVAKVVTHHGAVESAPAVVNVSGAPSISQSPSDLTVDEGAPASFTVAAFGQNLSYQWQKNEKDIPGEQAATYAIAATTAASAGSYRCVVTNPEGSATSNPGFLVVNSSPVITTQPLSVLVDPGQRAAFSVVAKGMNLAYQWQKNQVDMPGETNSSLVVPAVRDADGGLYRCVVSNSTDFDISNEASLTVNSPPGFLTHPQNKLATLGAPVTLTVTLSGLPTTVQWLRNNVAIQGATGTTLSLAAITAADAGDYVALLGSGARSLAARLIVISPAATQRVAANGTATFKLNPSQTTGVEYQWLSPTSNMLAADTRVSGPTTATLTIKSCSAGDVGNYICQAKAFTPEQMVDVGPMALEIVTKPQVDSSFGPPPTIVAGAFQWQLVASQSPTKYIATGLPAGLVLNTTTGLVTGSPNAATKTPALVKVSASNAAGTGPVHTFSLTVDAFPVGAVGSYSALVESGPGVNDSLGGFLTATVTTTGSATCALRLGAVSYPFTKRCVTPPGGGAPTLQHSITRKGLPSVEVNLTFGSPADTLAGTVAVNASPAKVDGGRHVWNAKTRPATSLAGSYNASTRIPGSMEGNSDVPQGYGWLQTNIAVATGLVTGSGRTPDGAVFTLGGTVWPDGRVPVSVLLYNKKGSLHGAQTVSSHAPSSFADNGIGGTLTLIKTGPSSTADRVYKTGIAAMKLTVEGEKWQKPSAARLILGRIDEGVYNAYMQFREGGLTSGQQMELSQSFRITSTHTAKLFPAGGEYNPRKVTLSLVAATGTFSGNFSLVDPHPTKAGGTITRIVPFAGVLGRNRGYGHFILPELPNLPTSPAFSGSLEIRDGL